jgi:hypothetical protein
MTEYILFCFGVLIGLFIGWFIGFGIKSLR